MLLSSAFAADVSYYSRELMVVCEGGHAICRNCIRVSRCCRGLRLRAPAPLNAVFRALQRK